MGVGMCSPRMGPLLALSIFTAQYAWNGGSRGRNAAAAGRARRAAVAGGAGSTKNGNNTRSACEM